MKYKVTTPLRVDSQYVLDWPRWSAYEVGVERSAAPSGGEAANRSIYPTGERLEPYRLTQEVDLVNPFAELALVPKDQQEQRLLEFTREFGLLGQTVLAGGDRRIANAPPIILPPTRRRETQLPFQGAPRMADEFDWVLSHARNVDLIMRLHHARRAELDQLLASLIERTLRVRVPGESGSRETRPRTLNVPQLAPPWVVHVRPADLREPGDRPLAISRRIIGALLNPNLREVAREYDPTTGMPRFQFRALVQVLYWQLADRLGHWSIRRCRCGIMFFADHGRQVSHSRECFRRFYMRDFRKGELRRARSRRNTRKR